MPIANPSFEHLHSALKQAGFHKGIDSGGVRPVPMRTIPCATSLALLVTLILSSCFFQKALNDGQTKLFWSQASAVSLQSHGRAETTCTELDRGDVSKTPHVVRPVYGRPSLNAFHSPRWTSRHSAACHSRCLHNDPNMPALSYPVLARVPGIVTS
ncbi:hypothetical protein EV126DRAFT_430722 [Verticillium dahliae]|nr:hypothetical protein EV126DRAFT_436377 [Verticillium dahliae]KAH6691074.1 hypothetical protein EV126DRAFT_430722 [Verticillium dahliae]